jgi:hypothetical protein
MNEVQAKIYLVKHPSSLDDKNYIARISEFEYAGQWIQIKNPAYSQKEVRRGPVFKRPDNGSLYATTIHSTVQRI